MSKRTDCWLCETSAGQHEEHLNVDEMKPGSSSVIDDSGDPKYSNRLLIGTPSRGNVRIEWVAGRYGQTIPTNWSMVQLTQFMAGYIPVRYQVADAQNLIVKAFMEMGGGYEWLILYEDDVVAPPDTFLRLNKYMRKADVPVVSGLYYTKSVPPEPMIYRGRGNSFYTKWKLGDLIYCDGVPTGLLLIHGSIIRKMWDESEEYMVRETKVQSRL